MNMATTMNLLVICGILALITALAYFFLNRASGRPEHEAKLTYDELMAGAKQMVNDYISVNVSGMGLPRQVVKRQENQRRGVARSVRACCSGNRGARAVVKDMLCGWLVSCGIDETNID